MIKKYAHSKKNKSPEKWQLLSDHLLNVAKKASEFAAEINNSEDWAWNAGILHDIGKASEIFQAYLYRVNKIKNSKYNKNNRERINHSSSGAKLIENFYENNLFSQLGRIISYQIAGHHAGLPDYDIYNGGAGALIERLKEGERHLKENNEILKEFSKLNMQRVTKCPHFIKLDNIHFYIRMLFSCLVDADFLDTEIFMEPQNAALRKPKTSLHILKKNLNAHMRKFSQNNKINQIRHSILDMCKKAAKREPGIFSLNVPTGGGKTLSAMSFAINHALLYNKKRIIYVIPYTSIIEQTAKIMSDIFGSENVIEHHSDINPELETQQSRFASENWDAPIIITTNVQFFESMFAYSTNRCRKLHNIINSVVIFDEVQMIPSNFLLPCVSAINELTKNYNVTAVLSTATQPTLPNLNSVNEIIPQKMNLHKKLKRTNIIFPTNIHESTKWEKIAHQLAQHQKVLCIVNTRHDCYELYKLMPPGTIHLSSSMCGSHRSFLINDIKKMLTDNNKTIRVISTQLIEAGVDIDFPVVYRSLTGLDSIIQAAGRCNREWSNKGKSKVYVFVPPKQSPQGLLRKKESATIDSLSLPNFDPQSNKGFAQYFQLFYNSVNDIGKNILDELKADRNTLGIPFRSVGKKFKLIQNKKNPVFVLYGEGKKYITELQNNGFNRFLNRKLQRYIVNLYSSEIKYMLKNKKIQMIEGKRYSEADSKSYIQIDENCYSPNTGFSEEIFKLKK